MAEADKELVQEIAKEYGISFASFMKMASVQLAKEYLKDNGIREKLSGRD